MNKKQIVFLVLCVLLSQHVWCGEARVTFFDVGQGHCTLVKFPGQNPLLIDAGSTDLRAEGSKPKGEKFKKDQQAKVLNALKQDLGTGDTVNVIISHGDKDHYCWLNDIFPNNETSRKSKFSNRNVKLFVLLGGSQSDYSGLSFAKDDKVEYSASLALPVLSTANSFFGWHAPNSDFKILSALKDGDKNDKSIVVKCRYGGKSFLITGDATDKVTKLINDADAVCDVLQLSHHGAATHGSNDEAWLKKTKAKYAICSAGTRGDYQHPDWQILDNIEKASLMGGFSDSRHHLVRFHRQYNEYTKLEAMTPVVADKFEPLAFLSSNYILFLLKIGIFNTTDSGDIHFEWRNGTDFTVSQSRVGIVANWTDEMLKKLLDPNEMTSLRIVDNIISIRLFSPLKASDWLKAFFLQTTVSEVDFQTLDFTGYTDTDVEALLQKITSLRRCKFPPNIDQTISDKAQDILGNRSVL